MYELTVEETFDAAHALRGYEGPCENLHGHTWKVQVQIQGEQLNDIGLLEDFKNVTLDNARNSMNEPGIARFDVTQQQDDFSQFVLVEVYRTPDDPAKHKETVHYKKWRDAVADMLVRDRHRILYSNVFPDENGWG